jgi:hypothetical protein
MFDQSHLHSPKKSVTLSMISADFVYKSFRTSKKRSKERERGGGREEEGGERGRKSE